MLKACACEQYSDLQLFQAETANLTQCHVNVCKLFVCTCWTVPLKTQHNHKVVLLSLSCNTQCVGVYQQPMDTSAQAVYPQAVRRPSAQGPDVGQAFSMHPLAGSVDCCKCVLLVLRCNTLAATAASTLKLQDVSKHSRTFKFSSLCDSFVCTA